MSFSLLTCDQMPSDFQHLFSEGYRARHEGDPAHARAIFLDAVRKAAEERDEPALAEALCGLAQAERDIGNCPAAIHHYTNAAVLYRRIGPPDRIAYAIRHEAELLRKTDHRAEAETLFLEAEAIYRQAGETHALDLANTLRGLALTKTAAGEAGPLKALWQEARDLYARLDVQPGVQECDQRLASLS